MKRIMTLAGVSGILALSLAAPAHADPDDVQATATGACVNGMAEITVVIDTISAIASPDPYDVLVAGTESVSDEIVNTDSPKTHTFTVPAAPSISVLVTAEPGAVQRLNTNLDVTCPAPEPSPSPKPVPSGAPKTGGGAAQNSALNAGIGALVASALATGLLLLYRRRAA